MPQSRAGNDTIMEKVIGSVLDRLLQVIVSLAAVAAFALGVLPALAYFTGPIGLLKFWLMPWLGYHFWMSTFTVVHHTAPHIPFKPAGEWNAAQAQLSGTVHCDYPRWCGAASLSSSSS